MVTAGVPGFQPGTRATANHRPLGTNKLPVRHQALPASRWKSLQQSQHQPHACTGVAVARVIQGHPDQRNRKTVDHGTQDQQIERLVSMFPGRAVHAHQDLARREVDQEQGQEDLSRELLIMDGAFHAPFLGFRRTGAREMRTEIAVVDALGHDHGQNNVDGTLMRVDTQRGHAGFEVGGEFSSL